MSILNKLKNAVTANKNPLKNEEVKKCYEIIYGLYMSNMNSRWRSSKKRNEIIRCYIKLQGEEVRNEEVIVKALELFEKSLERSNNSETASFLKEYNETLKEKGEYINYEFDMYDACFQEEKNIISQECDAILQVLKDNPTFAQFEKGVIQWVIKKYSSTIDSFEASDMARRYFIEKFYEGNETIKSLILEYFYDIYNNRVNHNTSKYENPEDSVVLAALKAVHFEEYGKERENYKAVTRDDIREIVLNFDYYSNIINNNPFDKDKYINALINEIDCKVLYKPHSSYQSMWVGFYDRDGQHFCDAVCHLAWKDITTKSKWVDENGNDVTDSTNPIEVFKIMWSYFKKMDI